MILYDIHKILLQGIINFYKKKKKIFDNYFVPSFQLRPEKQNKNN
jgi:hypothetical protein